MAKDGVSNSTGYQMPLFEFDEENLEKLKHNAANDSVGESEFGKYIVYVDESGDHSLQSIDQSYPIFALAFSIFHKRHYSETILPVIEKFKFNHFGHDQVILHEHEILKRVGVFNFSGNRSRQQQFMAELELEFRRICDGNNRFGIHLPFDILFSDKKAMSSGLQVADLVARPIGLNTLRSDQENRAFEV